ncbi:MAG: Stp1/IreP family PP2C-type Ser/Thr phosphatase [Ruminococcaceae bacterium]|nr:Stp1/IreP family PP2C-type Ser/Thr phosphatase [Oscillospiraceae bacterium]
MICSANTDVGMKRNVNQDTYILKTYSEKTCLCVVCDGMGGTRGGAEASKIAAEKFVSIIDDFISPYIGNKNKKLQGSDIKTVMLDALDQANTAVHDHALMHPTLRGMGTTLVAALVIQNTVFCVNVGDSRMYFMKGDRIKQITKDHSYVQYLLDIGQITEQEAENFPNKNIITRAVGTESSVKGDFIREGASEGTYMLLCSDGLTNFVSDEGIRDIVVGSDKKNLDQISLSLTVRRLIDCANENGGADNITALLVRF